MKKVLYLLLFSFTAQVMFAQGIDQSRLERLIMNKVAEAEKRRKMDQQKEENVQETHYKVATKTQNETAKIQQVANELHNNYRAENYISGLSQNPDYRAFTNQNDKKQQENRVAALEGRNTESAQKEKEELEKKRADDYKNAKQAPTAVPILNHESEIEMVRPYLVEQLLPPRGWVKKKRNGKLIVYMSKGVYEQARGSNTSDLGGRIEAAINDKPAASVASESNQDNLQKGQSQNSICDKVETYNRQSKDLTKRINDATTMLQKAASDKNLNYGSSQQKLQDTVTEVLLKKDTPKEVPPLTDEECEKCKLYNEKKGNKKYQ